MNEKNELQHNPQGDYATITVNGVVSTITPEPGYEIVPEGMEVKRGYKPYDYYAGWIDGDGWDAKNKKQAHRSGRWLAWERKIRKPRE